MEHSPYSQSSNSSPSLVNFQASINLPDIRLHIPFSQGANFGFRFVDNYTALPAHLLPQLQPRYLHSDPRAPLPRGGEFRPLVTTVQRRPEGFASAFTPPSKVPNAMADHGESMTYADMRRQQRQGHSDPRQGHNDPRQGHSDPRRGHSDPRRGHNDPRRGQPANECSDATEDGRRKKRCAPGTNSTHQAAANDDVVKQLRRSAAGRCPVCGVVLLRAARRELESHLAWELERLYNDRAAGRRRDKSADSDDRMAAVHRRHVLPACSTDAGGAAARLSPNANGRDGSLHGRWETYQKVRVNRNNRLRIKYNKRKPDEMLLTPTSYFCPVCNEPVAAVSKEQMNAHVEICLKNKGRSAVRSDDEDENVDVEGDTETTGYDAVYGGTGDRLWRHDPTGQQPMVLLHGGGFDTGSVLVNYRSENPPSRQSMTREDSIGGVDMLVVDDNDDNDFYKKNQPNTIGTMDLCENNGPLDVSMKKENIQDDGIVKSIMDTNKYSSQFDNDNQVVETLKARIRELESVSKSGGDKSTCLLCKGHPKDPVVSNSC